MPNKTYTLLAIVILLIGSLTFYLLRGDNVENRENEVDNTSGSDTLSLRESVEQYSSFYLTGDGEDAFEILSKSCRETLSKQEFISLSNLAAETYGYSEIIEFNVLESSGNLALVSYSYENDELNQSSESWVKEESEWKNNDC